MTPTATGGAQRGDRFIPNLKDKVDYDVALSIERLWTNLYDLVDRRLDILDLTLSRNQRVDRTLKAGGQLAVILRQDATGGWTWGWAPNLDGTLKFKGTALMTPLVTTANTYTLALFACTGPKEAILTGWLSGGNLA